MFRFVLCVFVVFFIMVLIIWVGNIMLVFSDNGGFYVEFVNVFSDVLEGSNWKIMVIGKFMLIMLFIMLFVGFFDLIIIVGGDVFW